MIMVPVSNEYLPPFEEMLTEYLSLGELYVPYGGKLGQWWQSPSEYISFWQELSLGPKPELNLVRTDCFWLLEQDRLLGDMRFRHNLNPALENDGGHIGYCVRPSERNRGLATKILSFGLEHARSFGLTRVLLTCKAQNSASIRVIERNGGIYADSCNLADGSLNNRYWITLH
jgi:predicted acetyltransferase